VTSGNKPDLRVKLVFKEGEEIEGIDGLELVFGEFSRLDAKEKKHTDDYKKLLRFCKDAKTRILKMLSEKDERHDSVKRVNEVLTKLPILGFLSKGEKIQVSVLDSFNGMFQKAYQISELQIPLEISSREMVEKLIKDVLSVAMFFKPIADQVIRSMTEIKNLPLATGDQTTPTPSIITIADTQITNTPANVKNKKTIKYKHY
jgi:hypothetical protein